MDQPPTPASVETDDPWPDFSDGELESYQMSIENPTTSPNGQMTLGNYRQTHTELPSELEAQLTWGFLKRSPKPPKQPKSLPDPAEFTALKGKKQTHSVRFSEDSDIVSNKTKKPKPRDPFNVVSPAHLSCRPSAAKSPTLAKLFIYRKDKPLGVVKRYPEMDLKADSMRDLRLSPPMISGDSTMAIFRSIDDLQEKFQKETPCETTEAMSPILQNLRLLNHEAMCAKVLHASHKLGNWSLGLDINMLQARVSILETEKRRHQHLLSSIESRLSALEIKVMRLESVVAENYRCKAFKEHQDENAILRKASGRQIKIETEDQVEAFREIEPGASIEAWISANDRDYFVKDEVDRRLG
ncbi:hypothetical protein FMUND_13514 [Fusarium mundagurra]|uniref:Uncharacterized protein n=1 Tax=Fusarium mundagurra TaxID=1567541 RepID=A0A8H6D3U2_9HYPO|nr:hypothetical protein FMUND_13514 [Fusarium mundagurra]